MAHPRISSNFFPNTGGDGLPLGNGKVAMPGFMANMKVISVYIFVNKTNEISLGKSK